MHTLWHCMCQPSTTSCPLRLELEFFHSCSRQWTVTIENTMHCACFECHMMCNWFKMSLPKGITTTKCWIPRHCELPTLMDEGEIILHVGSNFSEYTNRNEETCCRIKSFPNRWGPSTSEGQAETDTYFPRIGGKYHFTKWYLIMKENW